MLLDFEVFDLNDMIEFIECEEKLKERINEAIVLINNYFV
jgi:hypothetical protein